MNALDIVITVIGGFCLVRGLFRGIIKEMTSIIGVLVGFFAAYTYYPLLSKWLSKFIANTSYLNIISFLVAFTIPFLAIVFAGMILKHLFKAAPLGWADRVLGGTFAVVKAALIVSVVLVALTTFLPKNASVIKDSVLAPHVLVFSEKMVAVVPIEMKEKFRDNIKVLKETWKKL